jgi:molecular chaperone HtpG
VANSIADAPSVLNTKSERDWSIAESGFALRLISILDFDYFVKARVDFGKISHGLPLLIDTSKSPIHIVLDSDGSTVATILKLFETDYSSITSLIKDFVRTSIFTQIANLVPSSTRQGAEAFLKAIRRPREIFEIDTSDLGTLQDIWSSYLEGTITLSEAASQSAQAAQQNFQVVDTASANTMANVLPDILENDKVIQNGSLEQSLEALPAITRMDKESNAKLLTIPDTEPALKGYRCFIAMIDRIRTTEGEFFLQPHKTEIVWGGQKALYIFQHHSQTFGLYYELQANEVLANESGGGAFPTCTIVIKDKIYIPVPDIIRKSFIPEANNKKRFEVRSQLLYPDTEVNQEDESIAKKVG